MFKKIKQLFKKEDNAKYLNYKRGHIIEKDRLEREHLLLENDPLRENDHLPETPKGRISSIAGVLGLILFLIVFMNVARIYTHTMYGEKTTIDLASQILSPISSSDKEEENTGAIGNNQTTDEKEQVEGNEKTDQTNATTDSPVQNAEPTWSIFKGKPVEQSELLELDSLSFAVEIHEETVQSIKRIKQSAIQYLDYKVNKIALTSTIQKERLRVAKSLYLVEMRLVQSGKDVKTNKDILTSLQASLIDMNEELINLPQVSRSETTDLVNTIIEKENKRIHSFIEELKKALEHSNVEYTEEDGQLIF